MNGAKRKVTSIRTPADEKLRVRQQLTEVADSQRAADLFSRILAAVEGERADLEARANGRAQGNGPSAGSKD
jgi:hypothetical protein